MSSIRGLNNSTIQATPSPSTSVLNMTSSALNAYLRSNTYQPNMTTEQLNILLGDPSSPILENLTQKEIYNIISFMLVFMLVCSLGYYIVHYLDKKDITLKNYLPTLTPITNWIKNKYVTNNNTQVLPLYRPKKAKESPFVGSMPTPPILPHCPNLEGAERGQNNIMFRVSVPYRRFQSSDNLPAESEHRITITTTVAQSEQGGDKN
jgi:hypothetical protein